MCQKPDGSYFARAAILIALKHLPPRPPHDGIALRHTEFDGKGEIALKNSNLSGKIYQEIKDMLVSLLFAPGTALREQVLADMLGVT